MFYDRSHFPFFRHFEEAWLDIQAEALALVDEHTLPYPTPELYAPGLWRVIPLLSSHNLPMSGGAQDRLCLQNRMRCPRTAALLRKAPDRRLAGFSILEPGCEIAPHWHRNGMYILHLGLSVPAGCGIEVEGQARTWHEGEAFAFHEKRMHRAWNRGARRRIAFLVDFDDVDGPDAARARPGAPAGFLGAGVD